MPNYVANVVSFAGDKNRIKEMLLAVQNDEFGPGSISFNKIIPMPPELDIEFTHQWAEEQMVVNCGTAKYKAGVQTEHEQVEGYDERMDLSVEVWYQFGHNGLPPEQEQTM